MKRLIIGFAIIVSPTLGWFVFTDTGRASWRSLVSSDTRMTGPTVIDIDPAPRSNDGPTGQPIVLVPARPAPTEAALRVHLSDSGSLASRRDRWDPGLIVTDPQGRRSGFDVLSDATLQEIPSSRVERLAASGTNGQAREGIVVTIQPASSTVYSLDIAGRQAGKYRMAVSGVSPALESITEIREGRVPADTSVHYRVNLAKIRSLSVKDDRSMVATVVDPADALISPPETRVIAPSDPAVVAAAAAVTKNPCQYFLEALKSVPHETLTRNDREFESIWDGKKYHGCEVRYVTNDTLRSGRESPGFTATEGTDLYRLGWRMNNALAADGPGTSIFGIENDSLLCLVSSDQPAYLDEKTERIIQSGMLRITIQCRRK